MPHGLIDTAAQIDNREERRIYGVTCARVINNIDCDGYHRVQISIAWLPGVQPWARVAAAMAGSNRGAYFIPQVDDEVLVAFEQGDVRQPYIVGSLWNRNDRPPANQPRDAANRRIIRTEAGHEVDFDDEEASIHITNSEGHQIQINRDEIRIEMSGGEVRIILNDDGDLTIETNGTLSLQAREIHLEAEQSISLEAENEISVDGGQRCAIQARQIALN